MLYSPYPSHLHLEIQFPPSACDDLTRLHMASHIASTMLSGNLVRLSILGKPFPFCGSAVVTNLRRASTGVWSERRILSEL